MTIRFIYRTGCSLCDAMWRELEALRRQQEIPAFDIEAVDIASDPVLEHQYGTRIPVLEGEGEEICACFLDESALSAYLSRRPIAV